MKFLPAFLLALIVTTLHAQTEVSQLLYGAAYYDEYMPHDRLDKDVAMMKEAGINVVRIAESTWSTVEPQDGVFDFKHIDRVLDAMHKAGIKVVIGTPTYAVPTWLVRKYPDVLVVTPQGQARYGPRQNMDITNPNFRFHAERVIRRIMDHVKGHPAIIGYQVDNETKSYNTSGPEVQKMFVQHMKEKFGTVEAMNKAFGLDYWSNRINSWDDFPSMTGSINASQVAEFQKFQRKLVTDYLAWQVSVIREYKKPEQFITHNFDFEWRGVSYGIQPDVDHFAAARALDVAGVDIYHPAQDNLTGIEIALGGDLGRCMKNKNYFVLETQAQGFPEWVPYPGQLRLQAFSHIASGANMVEYWHWHSIHNSAETYWKGLLSHDFAKNPTFEEAATIGRDFKRLSPQLVNIKKSNRVAILFSNEALSAFNWFKFGWGNNVNYNDIMRPFYDALYRMNIEVDFIDPSVVNLDQYKLIVVPALYAAPDQLLSRLNTFVKNGGHLVATFKSGFSDENVKVRTTTQPGILSEACGITYSQYTIPKNVTLKGDPFGAGEENRVLNWMELVTPGTARVLAYYDHPHWNRYAAVTENKFGRGTATYIACMTSALLTEKILEDAVRKAGLWGDAQKLHFPVISKLGTNAKGKTVRYLFNYSSKPVTIQYPFANGRELLGGKSVSLNGTIELAPWDVKIVEE